ncbi:MAG TPA: phospho-sugar mutase [Polyangiales bacterium]
MGDFAFRFGTAGIRARAGTGPGELHRGSVRVIAHAIGLALEPQAQAAQTRLICLGFDGRRDSRAFAEEIAAVLLGHGFQLACFTEPCPTPLLAFALRQRSALAGVMVTASHNPPEDNGIKLYLAGGAQLAAPLDAEIEALIASADEAHVPQSPLDQARRDGRLQPLGEAELSAYVHMLQGLVPSSAALSLPPLAYSALCGVGGGVAHAVFRALGAVQVAEVREQAQPRADFGGLRSPNPEEPEALARLTALAEREGSALAFAHDPDADRLAVLARDSEGLLVSLSGDEVGALIGDFLLSLERDPARVLLVSTLVSGGLLERICAARGAHFLRTPTGFKWIARLGRERAARLGQQLLFGYEEALGYAFFAEADDKDGSAALRVLCELARRLEARGASLLGRLDELAREHGLFATRALSVRLSGADGPAQVERIMDRLRALPLAPLLGPAATCEDHAQAATPAALLVLRDAAGDTRVCIRPSGTEPKLKLYLHVREAVQSEVAAARRSAGARLGQLAQALAPYLTA